MRNRKYDYEDPSNHQEGESNVKVMLHRPRIDKIRFRSQICRESGRRRRRRKRM